MTIKEIYNEVRIALIWLRIMADSQDKYYITKSLDILDQKINDLEVEENDRYK